MRHYSVRDVMSVDPATVTPATSLKDVADILVKQKVSSVPVLDLSGKVIGLVAETDLLRKEELQRDPEVPHSRHMTFRARRDLATAETAGEIMTTRPVAVPPGTSVAEAARLMDRHQVTCLPVVDDDGKMLGAVSSRDLLRVFLRPDNEIKPDTLGSQALPDEGRRRWAQTPVTQAGGCRWRGLRNHIQPNGRWLTGTASGTPAGCRTGPRRH